MLTFKRDEQKGSGCGTVGRAIASDASDPQFKSLHWQLLLTVGCFEKTKIKKKEAGNVPFLTKGREIIIKKEKCQNKRKTNCRERERERERQRDRETEQWKSVDED